MEEKVVHLWSEVFANVNFVPNILSSFRLKDHTWRSFGLRKILCVLEFGKNSGKKNLGREAQTKPIAFQQKIPLDHFSLLSFFF